MERGTCLDRPPSHPTLNAPHPVVGVDIADAVNPLTQDSPTELHEQVHRTTTDRNVGSTLIYSTVSVVFDSLCV